MGYAFDTGSVELPFQVTRRVGELRKDEDFLVREFPGLEQADQLLKLVVVPGLELPDLVEELHDPAKVQEGLGDHLRNLVLLAV